MVQGLVFEDAEKASKVTAIAYDKGLLAETSGPSDEVVKLLPPLTITEEDLDHGLGILADATATVCS
jgi:diaminobutyrate-2-oxoglutarate transaminase